MRIMRKINTKALIVVTLFLSSCHAPKAGPVRDTMILPHDYEITWYEFTAIPKSPHVDQSELQKPISDIHVPQGAKNLSLGKVVTCSNTTISQDKLAQITDGNKVCLDRNRVDLGDGIVWISIDLSREAEIYGLRLWHDDQLSICDRVVIQLSTDPEFLENVTTVFNNDTAGDIGFGKGVDEPYLSVFWGKWISCMDLSLRGKKARYIRCWTHGLIGTSTANSGERRPGNSFIEVEVWGKDHQPHNNHGAP